jgi:hypothetical protein
LIPRPFVSYGASVTVRLDVTVVSRPSQPSRLLYEALKCPGCRLPMASMSSPYSSTWHLDDHVTVPHGRLVQMRAEA